MTADSGITPWTLTMNAGGLLQRTFTLTIPGTGSPYPLTGITAWEYVARITAEDENSPLISITETSSAAGVITVVSTAVLSQVLLTIFPAATSGLAPQPYAHTLWSDPGTSSQFPWVSGQLIISGTAQP